MSRKYRQSGYQDDGGERRERRGGPRPPRPDGPRGRGLGAPTETFFACSRCGAKAASPGSVALDTVCRRCGADLHSCTNCRHFDPAAPLECREPIEHRVAAKAKRNTCERFAAKLVRGHAVDGDTPSAAKKAFDDLFDF